MKNKIIDPFKPLYVNIIKPSEYDLEKDIKRAVKLANQNKESYIMFDIGKLVGLYNAYKECVEDEPPLKEHICVCESWNPIKKNKNLFKDYSL